MSSIRNIFILLGTIGSPFLWSYLMMANMCQGSLPMSKLDVLLLELMCSMNVLLPGAITGIVIFLLAKAPNGLLRSILLALNIILAAWYTFFLVPILMAITSYIFS